MLRQVDAVTGTPLVDVIADRAEQKGTGRWTVQIALDLGVPVSGIAEAVFARSLSGHADLRAAARGLPGPSGVPAGTLGEDFAEDVRRALYASKIVAYAQGFDQLRAGSTEYAWDRRPRRAGHDLAGRCIIRAVFLDRIREAYEAEEKPVTLLAAPYFADALTLAQDSWRRVVSKAAELGIPAPVSRPRWPTTTGCAPSGCPRP
ncbi:hypothetical protein GCM10017559_74440 [Streptosporangium longisporum]|uniref:6-phosphogluconate dehydrogenase C-terminal domain-containing protein n=1 Tax=Streptosporangium longisporum TaxID=46187 RepID=A0ABP6L8F0_9ACTN